MVTPPQSADSNSAARPEAEELWAEVARLRQVEKGLQQEASLLRHDVTELRHDLTELRQAIENAVDGIVMIDARGIIQSVNRAVELIFGYDRQELVGRNVKVLMPEPYRAEHDGYLSNYLRTGTPRIIGIGREVMGRRKDGSTFPLDLAVSEVVLEGQRGFMGTIRDITARREAEQERERLEEQLRQVQKMNAVGRLAGGIAHDFNTLLGSIIGYSEMLLDRLNKDDRRRHWVKQIHNGAGRGAALTRQLLALSRRRVLESRIIDLQATLTEMGDMLGRLLGDDVELRLDLGVEGCRVEAGDGQIEQVILNLAVNAADAMPHGGHLSIRTSCEKVPEGQRSADIAELRPGPYVRLIVEDDGCGMDEDTRSRAFEPFFTTKAPGQGTGLGLSTVYGIVHQCRGTVSVTSQPGRGSAFHVLLPLASEPPTPMSAPVPTPACVHGSETLVVVEDNAIFLELLKEILEAEGYTVLAAQAPDEALSTCEAHGAQIHLLVTDIVMPGMTGIDLATRLGERYPDLKVLFMSGYADEDLQSRGLAASERVGAAAMSQRAFLQKPFSLREFVPKVRALLEGAPDATGG